MKYEDHEEFFDYNGDGLILVKSYGDVRDKFTVEELYQHFKARLLSEMNEKPEES